MIDGLPARFAKSTTDAVPYSSETGQGQPRCCGGADSSSSSGSATASSPASGTQCGRSRGASEGSRRRHPLRPRDRHAADRSGRLRPGRQAALETDLTEQKKLLASNKTTAMPGLLPDGRRASRKGHHRYAEYRSAHQTSIGNVHRRVHVPTVMQGWISRCRNPGMPARLSRRQGVRGRRDGRSRPALGVGWSGQRFVGVPAPGTVHYRAERRCSPAVHGR